MPYLHVTPYTLYSSSIMAGDGKNDVLSRAIAWVEAENIWQIWEIVRKWFAMMESGEDKNCLPDPLWNDAAHPGKVPLTQEVADDIIEEMDADFMLEASRFRGRCPPEFSRLAPPQRIAFAQEIYNLLKTSQEIYDEAVRRIANGEIMPPPTATRGERPSDVTNPSVYETSD